MFSPYYSGYYFDWTYIVLVLPMIILSLIIQAKMKNTFNRYSRIRNVRGITGAQAAEIVLRYYNIYDVKIVLTAGKLTDCFDPKTKTIMLSQEVFNGSTIAAVGVACHEAGHAAQYAQNYAPIKVRNSFVPVANIGSSLSIPLLLIGLFLSISPLIWVGIAFFGCTALFQLITLPVEFNASGRALSVIESTGVLNLEEKTGARKVLTAAALTYVAAFATSVAQLLRLIIRFGGRRK